MIAIVESLLVYAGLYLAIGALFALVFVSVGVRRIDSAAQGVSLGFKLTIFTGCMLLWPLMLVTWMTRRASSSHDEPDDKGNQ